MPRGVYIVHHCKNTKLNPKDKDYCNNCFIDVDKNNSQSPPKWKYCPECEAKGFKNPRKINSTRTPEQIEAFKKRMEEYRKSK